MLPSQSVIEGEIGPHFERILHVGHDVSAPFAAEGQRPDVGIAVHNVVQEIVRAVVGEVPVGDTFVRIVQPVALHADPHLNGVPASNNAQVVVAINRRADFRVELAITGTIEGAAHVRADGAGQTVGGGREGTRSILVVVQGGTVDSPAELVNDGRREGVR